SVHSRCCSSSRLSFPSLLCLAPAPPAPYTLSLHDALPICQSIKSKGWLPNLFRGIVAKAKDFLQNLIREKDMPPKPTLDIDMARSEEHTSELQSRFDLVCRLLLEKKKKI